MGSGASINVHDGPVGIIDSAFSCYLNDRENEVVSRIVGECLDIETFRRSALNNPSCVAILGVISGQRQMGKCPALITKDWTDSALYNIFESIDNEKQLHVEDRDTTSITKFMLSHKLNTPCSVSAESQGLDNLSWLDDYVTNKQFLLVALSVSSNELTERALCESKIRSSECLAQLNIGGNQFHNISELTRFLPSSLLILDLSFTEGLQFSVGAFLSCPQLQQLCLDGCGIETTVFPPSDAVSKVAEEPHISWAGSSLAKACEASIFYGLIGLVNLSLKENLLETVESFRGLSYFTQQFMWDEYKAEKPCKIRNISIADNPVCETSAEHKKLTAWIVATLPSVQRIDDKAVKHTTAAAVDHTSAQYRAARAQQATLSGAGVTDTMEREFAAALKGEKDVAVVS
jgi:hypothetical protein